MFGKPDTLLFFVSTVHSGSVLPHAMVKFYGSRCPSRVLYLLSYPCAEDGRDRAWFLLGECQVRRPGDVRQHPRDFPQFLLHFFQIGNGKRNCSPGRNYDVSDIACCATEW